MFTRLKTNRLILKLITIEDLEKIHKLHTLPESDTYNTLGIPESIEDTKTVISRWLNSNTKGQSYTFKIEEKESKLFVGLIALNLNVPKYRSAEVWYKLFPLFWNKGFATEALQRLLKFGFQELNLHRIEAGCAVENTGSIRVLEKVGMIKEGRMRQILPLKSGWSDNFHYAILESDKIK